MKFRKKHSQFPQPAIAWAFKQLPDSGEAYAVFTYGREEVDLNFEDRSVTQKEAKPVYEGILRQLDMLVKKSVPVLIALHQQLFENEYEEQQCSFGLFGIEVLTENREEYIVRLDFSLDSRKNIELDPYFTYSSEFKKEQFPDRLTLVGVQRR